MTALVSPRSWRRDTWICLLGALALGSVLSLQSACGAGAKACAVVDVAHDACTVVRVLAPDGGVEELTAKDLEQAAAAKRASRGAVPRPAASAEGR